MYFLTRRFWLAAAVASDLTLSSPLVAQTIEKGPVRTVLALGRVASMIETPMYFKLSRVTIPCWHRGLSWGPQHDLLVIRRADSNRSQR